MTASVPYYSYSAFIVDHFGERVQKLAIDAGFTCPNRDGTLGTSGCTFCNNQAFNPSYCHAESQSPLRPVRPIAEQIEEGINFHQWRYRKSRSYLAYFQAYSNTYAPLAVLRQRYEEALAHPQVVGLVIGTRPDCVSDEILDYLSDLATRTHVMVEYGVESCYDDTLLRIERGHDFACTQSAIQRTHQRGISCGAHIILGLPGENRQQMLHEASILSDLPIDTLKLHQLQVLRGTTMYQQMMHGTMPPSAFSLDQYIQLVCDMLERLRPTIAIERFAGEVPPRYQAQPNRAWRREDGRLVRNEEIAPLVVAELQRRGSRQGCRYQKTK